MKNQNSTRTRLVLCSFCLLLFAFLIYSCSTEPKLPTYDEAKIVIWDKITMAAEKWSSGEPLGYAECASKDIVWIDDLAAQKPVIGSDPLKEYLGSFKGKVPNHKFRLTDSFFQFYDDIVIVTYRYQGILEGEALPPWKVTSVYKYENGDWWSVHENWSTVEK